MKQKLCYRFVKEDMTSDKDRVTKWEIGKWNKVEGKLKCCENGLHASLTPLGSLQNIYGDKWFIAEYKMKTNNGIFITPQKKLAKESMRILLRKKSKKDKFKQRQKEILQSINKW